MNAVVSTIEPATGLARTAPVAGVVVASVAAVVLAVSNVLPGWIAALVPATASVAFALSRGARVGERSQTQAPGRAERLHREVLPVWQRQLVTVREHGDRAAATLAVEFQDIVNRLETALGRSRAAASDVARSTEVVRAADGAKAELVTIVSSIEAARRARDDVLDHIAGHTTDIAGIAGEVRQIAMQISLLSLNATIEAARAGPAGVSFSVVVREMRQLATRVEEMGENMTRRVAGITASVETMTREARAAYMERTSSIERAESKVGEVIDSFAAMSERLGREVAGMQEESDAVRSRIADAMVELQYQDRVSQIIAHVAADMKRLGRANDEALATDGADEEWFEQMTGRFSTPEEFENLRRNGGHAAGRHDDITFFS